MRSRGMGSFKTLTSVNRSWQPAWQEALPLNISHATSEHLNWALFYRTVKQNYRQEKVTPEWFSIPESHTQFLLLAALPWGHTGRSIFSMVSLFIAKVYLPVNSSHLRKDHSGPYGKMPWFTYLEYQVLSFLDSSVKPRSILWHMHDLYVTTQMKGHLVMFIHSIHHK